MNDGERQDRDSLLREGDDTPALDTSEARREAGRPRRRQTRNVAAGVVAAAIVFAVFPGLDGHRPPSVLDELSPSPTSVTTPNETVVHAWPGDLSVNPPGTYSWDPWRRCSGGSCDGAWLQNGTDGGSGVISIHFDGIPAITRPHEGRSVTISGHEGSYRAGIRGDVFLGVGNGSLGPGYKASCERWMVDVQGTTVAITLCAGPTAPAHETVEAHEITGSIQIEPRDADPGFRLLFALPTKHWSGNPG